MSKKSQRATLKKVGGYLKVYWFLILVSLVLAVVSVTLTLYLPILIGRAIDQIVDRQVNFVRIAQYLVQMLLCVGITTLAQWLMNIINNRVTFQVVGDLRQETFEKIQRLPLKYLDAHQTGDIVSRMISDVEQFADGLLLGFTQLFTGVLSILGTFVFMVLLDFKIALLVVGLTPLSLFVASFIAKRTYHMFQKQSETRGNQTAYIEEMIGNAKVVKAYGHEAKALESFDLVNDQLSGFSLKAIFYSSITNPATRFVNALVYALVGVTGCFRVIAGGLTVGGLSSFLSYANQYTKPFNEISSVITELQNALACASRIFSFLEENDQRPEADFPKSLAGLKGKVSFEDVSFSYQPEKPLIEHLNLQVQPGEKVAIVGPTGCGKSTLINLLMNFYEVNQGKICIDDVPITSLNREELRKSFGMVLQETWLKQGTIRDNLLVAKEDATEEELIAAAKSAHAHSFIKRLPKGYDTLVSEEGGMLSQGQKQLLCIARVMLLDPPMLILDEATSSIDTRTEQKIQSAFLKLMAHRTSFIVAHRLSTIKDADVILVMKEGSIVEQGNHEELIKKQGFYAKLYESQFA